MTGPWPPGDGGQPEGAWAGQPLDQPPGQLGAPQDQFGQTQGRPGPPQYPPPYQPYGRLAVPRRRTNSLAVTSLICAVTGLFMIFLGSIPAIVFGAIALRQIRKSGEKGRRLALAGVIIGLAGIVLAIVTATVLLVWLHTVQRNCTTGC